MEPETPNAVPLRQVLENETAVPWATASILVFECATKGAHQLHLNGRRRNKKRPELWVPHLNLQACHDVQVSRSQAWETMSPLSRLEVPFLKLPGASAGSGKVADQASLKPYLNFEACADHWDSSPEIPPTRGFDNFKALSGLGE